ncbi:calcineurin-like phosphoesterase domain-containing protein [Phthorimaea operculella]|nr:calcineurin-like phosphoesterase domain-containing protein [Phthorimaea operculella]
MYFRRSATSKYIIAFIVGVALYCEWIIYAVQPYYWSELECPGNDPTCVKVLFVADPQIQGDDAVPPPLSYLFNWDIDRYLKATFQTVLKQFKPEVIVYLGDLMDEGSQSSLPQFHKYVKRLANIFDIDYLVVQIWLPGDNDIGGENEPIKRNKVAEFAKVFNQPDVITYRNISFYKVNGITQYIPQEVHLDTFKIVVSHYPVTVHTYFGQMVNNKIRPQIYFCAHDHESKYVTQSRSLTFRETTPFRNGNQILDLSFDANVDEIYEIYVPTCSYRMGTSAIGFGAAVFENHSQRMRYTVFWSSQSRKQQYSSRKGCEENMPFLNTV